MYTNPFVRYKTKLLHVSVVWSGHHQVTAKNPIRKLRSWFGSLLLHDGFFPKIEQFKREWKIMWGQRMQMAIWRSVVSWISEATFAQAHARTSTPTRTRTRRHARTHTHKEICTTYCFSTATMLSWKRNNVTLYVHYIACLLFNTLCAL
jgi:hypothetical protein